PVAATRRAIRTTAAPRAANQRRRHPTDRRAHALHVTAAGRRTLSRGRKLAAEAQNELLAPLDESERAQLHGLLLRIAEAAAAAGPATGAGIPPGPKPPR
ncbi:MAG TPA: MarR family winged helix-turn-helix transcriptional regulator, partial [Solirubrobacteraceae bacterium]